jgi:hypothetical protein
MPVLLLCQGDVAGKDMLRRAIEARYSINPPAIESLQIAFKGRARIKLGPVKTWIPVEAAASFVFPTHLRWDFVVKPLNLPVQRGIETFDGATYRMARGGSKPNEILETKVIASARGRLWAMAALLLTPMSDYYIKISPCGVNCIEALNTKLNDSVKMYLRDDYSVDYAEVECLNPDTQTLQKHTLRLENSQCPVDGLMLPSKVSAYWDDEIYYEMQPVKVDAHPELPEALFNLDKIPVKP